MSAVEQHEHSGGGHGVKASLTKKLGPFPIWAWGIGGGALIALYIRSRKASASSSTSATAPADTTGLDTSGGGLGGGAGAGGGDAGGSAGTSPVLDPTPPPSPTFTFNIQTPAPPIPTNVPDPNPQTIPTANPFWQYEPNAVFDVPGSVVQAANETAQIDEHPVITQQPNTPHPTPGPNDNGIITTKGPTVQIGPPPPAPKPVSGYSENSHANQLH